MSWKFLIDHRLFWKPHIVQDSLVEDLEEDLERRSSEMETLEFDEKVIDTAELDLPGMICTTRSVRVLDVDGFRLEIPSQDFASFQYDFETAPVRKFDSGKEYVKIHGWRFCFVVTPAQRQSVLAQMVSQAEEAEAEAKADNDKFVKAIDEINQNAGRTVVLSARAELLKGKGESN